MVIYLLDFQQISGTASSTIEFLILLKKCMYLLQDIHGTFMEYSCIQYSRNIPQGIFVYSIFPEHSSMNVPRNFVGKVFRIFREYIMGMFHEYSTNIYLPGGYKSRFFPLIPICFVIFYSCGLCEDQPSHFFRSKFSLTKTSSKFSEILRLMSNLDGISCLIYTNIPPP